MRFFLHIGVEKTGTSTIQESLLQNCQRLSEHGFYYLHMEGRSEYRDLPAYCMRPGRTDQYLREKLIDTPRKRQEFDQSFLTDFRKEMNVLPENTHTVIISSEHLCSRLKCEEELKRLKQLLSEYSSDFQIIVYIREQVDKATSQYSTRIKSGSSISMDVFVGKYLNSFANEYDKLLTLWEDVFDKQSIAVRLFDRGEFINGDLLQDFYHNLESALLPHLEINIPRVNSSLSDLGIQMARWVNRVVPKFRPNRGVSRLNTALISFITKCVGGKKPQLTSEQKLELSKHFEASNEKVRLRYFPERRELFKSK